MPRRMLYFKQAATEIWDQNPTVKHQLDGHQCRTVDRHAFAGKVVGYPDFWTHDLQNNKVPIWPYLVLSLSYDLWPENLIGSSRSRRNLTCKFDEIPTSGFKILCSITYYEITDTQSDWTAQTHNGFGSFLLAKAWWWQIMRTKLNN